MSMTERGPDTTSAAPLAFEPALAARGSSFNIAMRILPSVKRDAMLAIYAFCRAVDDIADDMTSPRGVRHEALEHWRAEIHDLYDHPRPGRMTWLAEPIRTFALAREDFLAIIDGMQMDVERDIRAPDLTTLDLYCDRVASAVGRLSVRIFGMPEPHGFDLAHHLGRALQITNILRDLDEDAELGRLYVPHEMLALAGIETDVPAEVMQHPKLSIAVEPLVLSARQHYALARRVMALAPRAATRCPSMMADVYEGILQRLEQRGFAAPRQRVRTPRVRVLAAFLRHGLM
jgi:squalene synthase HpnD